MKQNFPVVTRERECQVVLDYEEHNAIRYTAGYVVKAMERKYAAQPIPKKNNSVYVLKS